MELLGEYDLELVISDPFLSAAEAAALGARKVELDELCSVSDIVSLHAPELPETRHLLDERRLRLIRDGATVINTARGSLAGTEALTRHLESGRLNAVLDVVDPVPEPGSRLFTLPNVFLTPHVAGSFGNELHRLGDHAVAELERYVASGLFADPRHRTRARAQRLTARISTLNLPAPPPPAFAQSDLQSDPVDHFVQTRRAPSACPHNVGAVRRRRGTRRRDIRGPCGLRLRRYCPIWSTILPRVCPPATRVSASRT